MPVRRLFPCVCLVAAATIVAAACGGPQPPPDKPVADNKLLMEAVMDPAADHIWGSVGTIIDRLESTKSVRKPTPNGRRSRTRRSS